jgi:hypothetical protein
MLSVDVERDTTAPPELVLDTLRDFSPEQRGEIWSNVTPKHFTLHDSGPDFLDVTEGTIMVPNASSSAVRRAGSPRPSTILVAGACFAGTSGPP